MEQRRKYLEILRIEIDDLAEDIKALQEHYRDRRNRGEVTAYVLMENLAVLERESHGVAVIRDLVAGVHASDYPSLDELIEALQKRLEESVRLGAFEPVVRALAARKLAKVARYVRQELPAPPA